MEENIFNLYTTYFMETTKFFDEALIEFLCKWSNMLLDKDNPHILEHIKQQEQLFGSTWLERSARTFVKAYKKELFAEKDNEIIYLFCKFSAYDNTEEPFIEKYKNNSKSKVIKIGVDDNPWPDGSYHDILGGEAYGYTQYVIITDYNTIVENNWSDNLRYKCTSSEIEKLLPFIGEN